MSAQKKQRLISTAISVRLNPESDSVKQASRHLEPAQVWKVPGLFWKANMPVSFAKDIVPLFRPVDVEHMKRAGVPLDDFAYMSDPEGGHRHATNVGDYLTGKKEPRMPPGGPFWIQQQLDLYAKWMSDGYQP
jgi:hypothetical protein